MPPRGILLPAFEWKMHPLHSEHEDEEMSEHSDMSPLFGDNAKSDLEEKEVVDDMCVDDFDASLNGIDNDMSTVLPPDDEEQALDVVWRLVIISSFMLTEVTLQNLPETTVVAITFPSEEQEYGSDSDGDYYMSDSSFFDDNDNDEVTNAASDAEDINMSDNLASDDEVLDDVGVDDNDDKENAAPAPGGNDDGIDYDQSASGDFAIDAIQAQEEVELHDVDALLQGEYYGKGQDEVNGEEVMTELQDDKVEMPGTESRRDSSYCVEKHAGDLAAKTDSNDDLHGVSGSAGHGIALQGVNSVRFDITILPPPDNLLLQDFILQSPFKLRTPATGAVRRTRVGRMAWTPGKPKAYVTKVHGTIVPPIPSRDKPFFEKLIFPYVYEFAWNDQCVEMVNWVAKKYVREVRYAYIPPDDDEEKDRIIQTKRKEDIRKLLYSLASRLYGDNGIEESFLIDRFAKPFTAEQYESARTERIKPWADGSANEVQFFSKTESLEIISADCPPELKRYIEDAKTEVDFFHLRRIGGKENVEKPPELLGKRRVSRL
ncbi:hypothetical protein V5O48_008815 [Marasmius crinis-equi]|uniref:Uncharacterized protein n=1 Tax=Marasmius crinis-equi TaxID=585013 RepID=A0ABR3FD03_9AGAR